jgi:hypothetical protein
MVQEQAKRLTANENMIANQVQKIEKLKELKEENERLVKLALNYETQIHNIDSNLKGLMEENKKLTLKLHQANADLNKAEAGYKTVTAELSKRDSDLAALNEKKAHYEARALRAEAQLKANANELDSLRVTAQAGSLFQQEQEAKYKEQIERLQERVALYSAGSNLVITQKVNELEGKLTVARQERQKLQQDSWLLEKRLAEALKDNERLKDELEHSHRNSSSATAIAQDCTQLKKDRDMLLAVATSTQAMLPELEKCKKEVEKLKQEKQTVQTENQKLTSERTEVQKEVEAVKAANLLLEKSIARQDEKITLLQEERRKQEDFIKTILNPSEQVGLCNYFDRNEINASLKPPKKKKMICSKSTPLYFNRHRCTFPVLPRRKRRKRQRRKRARRRKRSQN